jgi:hypothetical protein
MSPAETTWRRQRDAILEFRGLEEFLDIVCTEYVKMVILIFFNVFGCRTKIIMTKKGMKLKLKTKCVRYNE